MKILIIYATNSGGTYLAGEFIKFFFENQKYDVDLIQADKINLSAIHSYHLVIFGTNTWNYNNKDGQPHIFYLNLRDDFQKLDLSKTACAIYCLGDLSYALFCGGADILEEMIKNSRGKLIVDSLRINGYLRDEKKHNRDILAWVQEILKKM